MLTRFSAVLLALSLAACGGGSKDNADAPPHVDSRPVIDSAPFACQLDPSYAMLTLGATATPIAVNGQQTTEVPPRYAVAVLATLPMRNMPPRAALFMLMADNAGMFAAGGAGSLANPPNTGTYTLDSGDTCGGCLEGYTDYTVTGTSADLTTATQVYLVDDTTPGDLIITQSTGGAAIGGTSRIDGTYSNVNLVGYDPVTMNPNGCVSTVAQLNFFFDVTWPATFAPSNAPKGPHGIDMSALVTLDAKYAR